MQHMVDVLVIGSGTAGFTLALACSKAGRKVAVVDDKPFGGTCGMRGCEPEKFLVMAAEVVQLTRQMSEVGVDPPSHLDWPALIRAKTAFTSGVPDRTERALENAGVQMLVGTARFVSPEEVAVNEDTVRARAIVIATGARTAPLDFPGSELLLTAQDFMDLPQVPRRVLFIGGGCLALSMAHVARAAGATVTILQRGKRILKHFDEELVRRLTVSTQALGINVVTGVTASMAEWHNDSLLTYGKAGCSEAFAADLVINASGRVPGLDKLDLDAGKVEHSECGVKVNEHLQSTSNPLVWVVGDACDSPFHLSSVADMEAEVAAENILNGKTTIPDYSAIPTVVSTLPPVAQVGMTEQQAHEAGLSFRINKGGTESWPSSRRIGQRHGFYKVLVEKGSEKIVGAHIFGHNAGETINIFAMAMKFGLTTKDLFKVLWAYPTDASDIKDMIA
jgi:glutathione reductase (NADPH)